MELSHPIHPSQLPPDARAFMAMWSARMEQLENAGRGMTAFAKKVAPQWDSKYGTLMRMLAKWREHGAIGLIDLRKYGKYISPEAPKGLPLPFVEFWKGEYERFTRMEGGALQTHKELISRLRRWRRGDASAAIPGYAEPPPNQAGKLHPKGWHYSNLTRHLPEIAERKTARLGRQAAKQHLAKVYRTRVGTEPGQILIIDDQRHDVNVIWNAGGQIVRAESFDLMDFCSGKELRDGIQPRLVREDGTEMGLKQEDCLWMLLAHFTEEGYRADLKTHVLIERGSATVAGEIIEGFRVATNGGILIEKGGVDRRAVKGLLFDSPAKGNPRYKASKESLFRTFRNSSGFLPGATGPKPEEAPEEQAAIIRYTAKLLKDVPPEMWPLLKLELLTEDQYRAICFHLKRALDGRTDHKLEGWEALGFMENVFRLPGSHDDEWMPISDLQGQLLRLPPAAASELVQGLSNQDERLFLRRRMCPQSVWDAHKHKLTKLSHWTYSQILPVRMAHKREIQDQEIRLHGLAPEMLRFDPIAYNAQGEKILLRTGREYLVYCNPLSPDIALICDAAGAAIGLSNRIIPVAPNDREGIERRMGLVKTLHATVETAVARRAEPVAKRRKEMVAHNERLKQSIKGVANNRPVKMDLVAPSTPFITPAPETTTRESYFDA